MIMMSKRGRAPPRPAPPHSYAPEALVLHDYAYTPAALFRQFAKHGSQEGLMALKHREYPALLAASRDVPAVAAGACS